LIIFAKLLISNFQNNKGVTEQNFTKYCPLSKYFTQNELIELIEKNNHDIINNNDYKNYYTDIDSVKSNYNDIHFIFIDKGLIPDDDVFETEFLDSEDDNSLGISLLFSLFILLLLIPFMPKVFNIFW